MAADETEKQPGGRALDRRRQRALEALLNAASIGRAAEASEISTRTLFRYLAEPSFQAALHAARARALGQAESLLATASSSAVLRLAELLDDAPGVALGAARALLEHARGYAEVGSILNRLG